MPTEAEVSASDSTPAEGESPSSEMPTLAAFLPSSSAARSLTSLTPLVNDERAINRLLDIMLRKANLSPRMAASQLGVSDEAVRQYVTGRRSNPSLKWFLRFAQICGAKVTVELAK